MTHFCDLPSAEAAAGWRRSKTSAVGAVFRLCTAILPPKAQPQRTFSALPNSGCNLTPVLLLVVVPKGTAKGDGVIELEVAAAANAVNVQAQFARVLASHGDADQARIREFAAWVENRCRLTLNVKLFVLVDILSGGEYLNVHQRALLDSELFGRTIDEMLHASLQGWYARRLAFDDSFDRGHEFLCAGLTAGYGGLRAYDPICIELRTQFFGAADPLAYLPGDSLKVCFSGSDAFDAKLFSSAVSAHSHRQFLTATKYADKALSNPIADWPNIVSSPADYIEAIFVGKVDVSAICIVQILKEEYDRLLALVVTSIGSRLQLAEQTLVYLFRKVLAAEKEGKLSLEIVE